MKITKETIPLIEKALDEKLYDPQKEYLVNDGPYWYGGRASGKTTAYCIKLALSDGDPLDMRMSTGELIDIIDPDYGPDTNKRTYIRWFRRCFLEIWEQLKAAGLPVRELRY